MTSLMDRLTKWLIPERDRRSAERHPAPGLAAFYWTGAAPMKHDVKDISSSGFYLLTEERWYPGTLVMMSLQKNSEGVEELAERSISVQTRAVRFGEDGVGLAFILPDEDDSRRGQELLKDGANKKTLEHFLQRVAAVKAESESK